MSIMDFFRGTSQANAAAPEAQPAPTQAPQSQAAPGGETSSSDASQQVSGLESFADLWDTPAEGSEGQDNSNLDPSAFLNINPEEIQKAVSQVDFAQVLDPETLSQISEGGEGAQKAFASSMNAIARHVFSQSMIANATLVKNALGKSTDAFDQRTQQLVRQSDISREVKNSNPAFSHPSARPIVEAMQHQLARKHPQASPQEIANKANEWFTEFANEMQAPERAAQSQQREAGEMDWESFFKS